jgi:polyribonucleotide nucleotidyltransferase
MVESEAKELSEDQMLGAVLLVMTKCKLQFKRSKNLLLLLVQLNQLGCSSKNEDSCKIKRSI